MTDIHIVATAINRNAGGGFVILEQALKGLDELSIKNSVVFYGPELPEVSREIKWIRIDHNKKWISRLIWENIFFKKFTKKGDFVISFQNTLPKLGRNNVKSILYLHQPLPFSKDIKISIFTKQGILENIKKYFYLYFIKKNLKKDSIIIVQTDWIRDAFLKKSTHSQSFVKKMLPLYELDDQYKKIYYESRKSAEDELRNNQIFFYPANFNSHKNHRNLLIGFSNYVKKRPGAVLKLTLNGNESGLKEIIKDLNITNNVIFLGFLTKEKVFEHYGSSTALVFPSLIETLGLPLLEAGIVNLPILVSDLPYSRELLKDYENKIFFTPESTESIEGSFNKLENFKISDSNFQAPGVSWKQFWEFILNS